MKFAPIIVFTYNRSKHLRRTLNFLKKNSLCKKSEIFFFCDGPKNDDKKSLKKIDSVKKIVKNLKGFKKKNFFFHKKTLFYHIFSKVFIVYFDDLKKILKNIFYNNIFYF